MSTGKREKFSSRFTFIMAMAGSAIGLGNIWRFPYMVGEYGGAAFIIIYILCSLFISLPIFICEAIVGRRTGSSSYDAMNKLAPGSNWKLVGLVTVVTAFVITSYYSVVGGWSLDYFIRSFSGGLKAVSQEEATGIFTKFSSSVWEPLIAFTGFLALSASIVAAGVKGGIEKFTKWATPSLGILIIIIAVYSISLPGSSAGVEYLVKPDWSKLTPSTFSYALGQSFYSLSLGVGCVVVYSSFMKKSDNILASGGWTALFDTLFAIIAGFAVMPAVFAAGIEPGSGPSLVFETLPYIFFQMGQQAPALSRIITILFFLAILVAALTSSISMFEVCVEHMVDHKKQSRKKAAIRFFIWTWVLGVLCCLSFGVLKNVRIFGNSIFSTCDILSSNYLMTLTALVMSIFVGWKMDKSEVRDEFTNGGTLKGNARIFDSLHFVVKWIIPVMIVEIFVSNFINI